MSSLESSAVSPVTQGPAQAAGGNTSPAVNNQNNGDLHPFIEELKKVLPENAGDMPMDQLLERLKGAHPTVFTAIDKLGEAARRVSGLSEEAALHWKEKGNQEFTAGRLSQSILTYTQGLRCAQSNETMAALLNNRSTAFFQLHRFADACMDADRALSFRSDYWKALERRGHALRVLGFTDLATADIEAAAAQSADRANSAAVMQGVFGEATRGMSDTALPPRAKLSHQLKVERNMNGRGIFATARLEPGEVLSETPYAIAPRMEMLLSACSYCLQHASCLYHGEEYRRAGIKSRGFFCSEACASASWRFYSAAENNNPFFLICPNDALLAHRLSNGEQQFPQLAELDAAGDFDVVSRNTFGTTHLKTLQGNFSKELQPAIAAVGGAESIVSALALYMGAVTATEAERLRKAQRQILINAFDVRCALQLSSARPGDDGAGGMVHTDTTAWLGTAVYAVASLFNHACDPNCYASFLENPQGSSARLVVRALRPIMEGEELTIAYGGITRFDYHSLRLRLETIRKRYGFVCRCATCLHQVDEPVSSQELREHYIKAADYYQKGRRLIKEGNFATAVTVLLQSYEVVMRYICPPPSPPQVMVPKTHDALALAYFHLKDRAKCVEHLKAALATDLEIHHSDVRVAMVNVYSRLAFVVPDVAERQMYAEKAVHLLKLFYAPSSMLRMQIAYVESSYKVPPTAKNDLPAPEAP